MQKQAVRAMCSASYGHEKKYHCSFCDAPMSSKGKDLDWKMNPIKTCNRCGAICRMLLGREKIDLMKLIRQLQKQIDVLRQASLNAELKFKRRDLKISGLQKAVESLKRVPERIAISNEEVLKIPPFMIATFAAISKIGSGQADEVSAITGRVRAVESSHLNQLHREGWLNKYRVGRQVFFSLNKVAKLHGEMLKLQPTLLQRSSARLDLL